LPLTAQTVYPIASTSKAITATLLGILIEGILEQKLGGYVRKIAETADRNASV
jgi:CubicO group peptidase (beta-lactamase class C family)